MQNLWLTSFLQVETQDFPHKIRENVGIYTPIFPSQHFVGNFTWYNRQKKEINDIEGEWEDVKSSCR